MVQSLFWQAYYRRLSYEFLRLMSDVTYHIAIPELLAPRTSLDPITRSRTFSAVRAVCFEILRRDYADLWLSRYEDSAYKGHNAEVHNGAHHRRTRQRTSLHPTSHMKTPTGSLISYNPQARWNLALQWILRDGVGILLKTVFAVIPGCCRRCFGYERLALLHCSR